MMEQKKNEWFLKFAGCTDMEEQLRCFFTTAVNARPAMKKGLTSNYGKELETLLMQNIHALLRRIASTQDAFESYGAVEQDTLIRYHCQATMGMLRHWTEEDTRNLDRIVHAMYLTMSRGLAL